MFRFLPIISLSLLVLLILGGVFLWWPEYQDFSDLRLKVERKEMEIRQKEEYFVKLKVLSEKLEGYSEELAKIDSALLVDPSIPALFDFIQKTSSESGLILESLSMGKISSLKDLAGVQKISFSVSVSGSYSAFKNFLSVIYKNTRLIEVESIAFSSSEEKVLFTFDLILGTYSYQELKAEEQEIPTF